MSQDKPPVPVSSASEVDAFLAEVKAKPRPARTTEDTGRLLFAMDATASREPTWGRALELQGQMFEEAAGLGGLEVQLCFYRGIREMRRSRWLKDAGSLRRAMAAVRCLGGLTQIERVLAHAVKEARDTRINAVVFVGDVGNLLRA